MTIKWRLALLCVQLAVLLTTTKYATGMWFSTQNWFLAGLLAIVINPQLLEPYFSKPVDVVANGIIFLFIYATVTPTFTWRAWNAAAVFVSVCLGLSVAAALFGFRKDRIGGPARAARLISQVASSRVVYSIVFALSVVEWRPLTQREPWVLFGAWAVIVLSGTINWQTIWSAASGAAAPARIEGNVGPSIVMLSAQQLPPAGSAISLVSGDTSVDAVVLNRIRRSDDDWAEVHVLNANEWEAVLSAPPTHVKVASQEREGFVGSVDAGSTDRLLKFISTRRLEVGNVVGTAAPGMSAPVIYQIVAAKIERSEVKGGGHLLVRAEAVQLGVFDVKTLRFIRNRWVPSPGAAVTAVTESTFASEVAPPDSWLLLGHVIGTKVPVYLDTDAAVQGHLAILGMTKMGKTSLAVRLAKALSQARCVTILDQTGEYVGRRNLAKVVKDTRWDCPGLVVFEPKPGEIPADRAHDFLKSILKAATEEYKAGEPFSRVVIVDEAHQFVPEPSGLGFGGPGRESSIAIGLLMMQIRKYGMSVVLISQRTAVVAKSGLSQCENLIAFRSVDQTGLDYLEAIAGAEVRTLLPQLKQGEALVFGPAITSESPVAVNVLHE